MIDSFCGYDGSQINPTNGLPYTGYALHEACKEQGLTSLRTFYLVYLLNDDNEFLHGVPVVLSLKGLAASAFGQALDQFGKAMLEAIAGADDSLKKLAQAKASLGGLRNFYFITHLEGAIDGVNSNWITRPTKQDDGTFLVGGDLITDETIKDKVQNTAELNDGFAWKFASQMTELCGYHQLGASLVNALPEASQLTGIDVKSEALPF